MTNPVNNTTYNIIKLFNENQLPLSREQIVLLENHYKPQPPKEVKKLPYRMVINNPKGGEYVKGEYNTLLAAGKDAKRISLRHPEWTIRIEKNI
jgi:hypothetical protein